MARLVISKGTAFHKEYVFSGMDIITIGRARASDIFLPDPTRKVSRYHAAIVRTQAFPERHFVRDLSSLRATKVGGEIVFQRALRDGDVVQIAEYELTYLSQPAEKRRWSRLHVVARKEEPSALEKSTMLFTHHGLMKEIPLSPERREVLEELLRRAARAAGLTDLLEQTMAPVVRVVGADRGFVGLFGGDGAVEEVGVTGLRPEEQIEITDASFLDRLHEGQPIQDQTTLMAPILLHEDVLGFFCVDRLSRQEPFSPEDLGFLLTLGRLAATHVQEAGGGRRKPRGEDRPIEWPMEMVGKSRPMEEVFEHIREAATTDANVLVMGESGTGKELVARAIHQASSHSRGPFVAQNCAAITESLAESEIFGYAPKCGIHGADPQGAPGWFEMADGGTLFLDEVQALIPPLQDKFLRVLQDKEVWRIRARHAVPVRVNVIAATDQNLEPAIEQGGFRKALYYRFGKQIALARLRERQEDIPLLAHCFLDRYAARSNSQVRTLSHRALQRLQGYAWPGNVRELENYIREAVSTNPDKEVLLSWDFPSLLEAPAAAGAPEPALPAAAAPEAPGPPQAARPRPIREIEREEILEALESTKGNITKAAKLLGYKSRMTMLNKMDRYGIRRSYGDPEESA